MFADGTSVSYASDLLDELQNVLNSEPKCLRSWLITNRLSLNIAKTEYITIGSWQKLRAIDDRIVVKINELFINRVNSFKSLGAYIDDHLIGQRILIKFQKNLLQQLVL